MACRSFSRARCFMSSSRHLTSQAMSAISIPAARPIILFLFYEILLSMEGASWSHETSIINMVFYTSTTRQRLIANIDCYSLIVSR
mmetsp:Transcript_27833/g.39834  ORF Transcript_27833/g.39834 Transcript_27833/m.39834 type:complete len:86 (-) Transcript_27833:105-362(-)